MAVDRNNGSQSMSGRPRKISARAAHSIARKASQNPHFIARDFQQDLGDTGVLVHCSATLHKYGLHVIRRKPASSPQNSASELCI